jgi:GAF domain-containing protein
MNLYEQAIRSAQANGFVQNEALAYELASAFYAARDFQQIAQLYLRNARDGYLRWGASGKVRQIDGTSLHLRTEEHRPALKSTIAASVEHLDLTTVIKVSQAISSEIVPERLIETLMRTAIEQAGAERGLLVVSRGREQRIAAEAMITGNSVSTHLCDATISPASLPESVMHLVLRTQESIIIDDAKASSAFATDPYFNQSEARSVLCMPLVNQAKVAGVLYLENSLAASVFAPARTTVLKLLASQAAISLEITRLYQELAQREARIRRLVDSNVIGIVIWDLDGRLIDANDAFLRMVQYEREDLKTGLRWFDMTPPDWQEVHAKIELEELQTTGIMQAREKEYFR